VTEQERHLERSHVNQVAECLRVARLRLELGEGEVADVWRFEQEWLRANAAFRRAEAESAVARVMLNTLLGRPGDYPFVADWQHFTDAQFFTEEGILSPLASRPEGVNELVDLFISQARNDNPDLARAEQLVTAARADVDNTSILRSPRVGFYASLDFADQLADRPGWAEENQSWTLGATVELPLWLGGKRLKKRERLRVEIGSLESRRDQAALELEARIRADLERILSRSAEFPLLARAAELANQYYPDVLSRYASGKERLSTLLEAVGNVQRASYDAITTEADYFQAVAGLIRDAGVSPNGNNRSPGEQFRIMLSGGR
jgi:outer membrane protein TolC